MKLNNNLKLFRIKAGNWTQQQLAEQVGCSRQTINSIETGKFNPSIELVLRLSKTLNASVEELFFFEQEMHEEK
ncbi:MAG: helix-turn-helix transcriptional regulator [Oligoflexia bacterium]|nr:helix-turn-helix transcriptional regulator [Oligoflexia bacterium]